MSTSITLVLADDHPLIRTGLRTTLEIEPDIVVAGEASDGDEAQRQCADLQPDILLLDLNMPGPTATTTLAALAEFSPRTRVIVLTAYEEDAYIRGLLQAGAMGYVLKDEAPVALVQAVRSVAQGGTWFSKQIVAHLVVSADQDESDYPLLTEREGQIVRLIGQGWDNSRIAKELCLSEQTVRNYVSRLYGKLDVETRAEAVVWARDHVVTA